MPIKKIKLKDGSTLLVRDGYLYRSITQAQYESIMKTGKMDVNDFGRVFFSSDEKLSTELAMGYGGSDHILRVKVEDLPELFKDEIVSQPDGAVISVYTKEPISAQVLDVRKGGDFAPLVPKPATPVKPNVAAEAIGQKLVASAENASILKLYKDASKQLIRIIEAGDPKSPFTQFRQRQFAEIQRVIGRLEGKSREWVDKEIRKMLDAGDRETLQKIRSFKERHFDFDFAGVNERQIGILTEQAYVDFGRTVRGLSESAKSAALDRAALSDTVIRGAIQGSSFSRTTKEVISELQNKGFTVLKTKNGFGRRLSLETYSNMLVRSQNILGYNMGAKARMLGAGRRYAIFPTIRPDIDGIDICNTWEDKKFVDLLNDELPPRSTHPNCRHTIQPVSFEQLQAERPDLYKNAIAYFEQVSGFDPFEE